MMFNRDFGNYNYKCDHHLKIMPYNVIKEMTPKSAGAQTLMTALWIKPWHTYVCMYVCIHSFIHT